MTTSILQYNNQLNELNKNYNVVLDELVKVFPKKKMYPEFPLYDKVFEKHNEEIKTLENNFSSLKSDLETNVEKVDKNVEQINDQISIIEKENKELRKKLADLINSSDASGGMLSDFKYLYNQQLTANWILFFTIVTISYKFLH